MNKKGGFTEIFLAIALFFIMGFILLISARVTGDVLGGLQGAGVINETAMGATVNQTMTDMTNLAEHSDFLFLIIFAGYLLVLILTSLATDFHPAFFFIFLLLSIIGTVVSVPFSNAYQELSTSSAFNSVAANFTITNMVLENLPFVIMLISGALLIFTYAKQRT